MKEKKRKEQQATPGGDGGIFDSAPATPQNVSVSSGPYAEDLPVAGMPVGEIRKRFAAQLDIAPGSQAIVDGNSVGDDYSMKAGEALTFIQHAGEKGSTVTIEGNKAIAKSEVANKEIPIDKLVRLMVPGPNTGNVVLPHGVRAVLSQGNITVLAWEKPPHIAQLGWIAKDSPRPYGPGTKYRKVRISLPYLVILAPFCWDTFNIPQLLLKDECFFRTEPLKSLDDELSYPGLLNCSKFPGKPATNGSPLSWICTQHLKPNPGMESGDPGERLRASFEAVRYCLLETSFNLSSEHHHEGNSWYGESKKIDPRIATIEAWEEATKQDPLFVLEVPWIKTGHSVKQAAGRMFNHANASDDSVKTADDLARIIFNG